MTEKAERDRREIAEFAREVRARVWSWDPAGLVELGVPDDEYDCLIGPVTGGLREALSADVFAERLRSFVRGHFGVEPAGAASFARAIADWFRDEGKPSAYG